MQQSFLGRGVQACCRIVSGRRRVLWRLLQTGHTGQSTGWAQLSSRPAGGGGGGGGCLAPACSASPPAQLWLSSLVTSGFLLLLPAQAATLTSCTGVSSSATECHVVPATETRPHGPSNCNWPPGPGSAHPAQATWQPELWLAVGDLYPHPAGLACHGPAWHMNGLAGRTYVSCHPSHQPSYSLAHYFCNMGNGSLNEVMNLNT